MGYGVNGGRAFISYGGGGGRPSEVVGELLEFRTIELSEGENKPLGGRSWGANEFCDCGHGCGVLPVGN